MSSQEFNAARLVQRLTSDRGAYLAARELDAVLSWLSGNQRSGASELIRHLGTPRERPDLARSILEQLDVQLFTDGKLILQRAFVDAAHDREERRARFRRLMTAFHPDHHPDDTGWLTPRSQAIHDAWRNFRNGQDNDSHLPAKDQSASRVTARTNVYPKPARRSARLIPDTPGPLTWLRMKLLNARHLQAKAMLLIAVVASLPVAWVYFTHQPYRDVLTGDHFTPEADTRVDLPPPHAARVPDVQSTDVDSSPLIEPVMELAMQGLRPLEPTEPMEKPPSSTHSPVSVTDSDSSSPETRAGKKEETEAEGVAEPQSAPAQIATTEKSTPPIVRINPEMPGETAAASAAATKIPDPPDSAGSESDPPEKVLSRETELRITELIGSFTESFERGHLDGLLGHFTDHPRENRNEGRRWIRQNYQSLFQHSSHRRLRISIDEILVHDDQWAVVGQFELQVEYPERRPVRVIRNVRYLISEEREQLRISSIEY